MCAECSCPSGREGSSHSSLRAAAAAKCFSDRAPGSRVKDQEQLLLQGPPGSACLCPGVLLPCASAYDVSVHVNGVRICGQSHSVAFGGEILVSGHSLK